jgi:outer membrane biosynthesis protein TonB
VEELTVAPPKDLTALSVIQVGSINGPDIFHDEVRSKAPNLKFTPGLQNGKPVKVWVTVPFNFRLKN